MKVLLVVLLFAVSVVPCYASSVSPPSETEVSISAKEVGLILEKQVTSKQSEEELLVQLLPSEELSKEEKALLAELCER